MISTIKDKYINLKIMNKKIKEIIKININNKTYHTYPLPILKILYICAFLIQMVSR